MTTINLTRANLSRMNKSVSVPGYDRKDLSSSIVHIGLGNFHRAHQAKYLDELIERGIERTGIFEINLVPDALPLADILREQDYLYTLVTKSPGGEEKVRVVGPVLGYLNAGADREAALLRMADSGTSLITLTVTEKGYYYDKKTGEPDTQSPEVQGDLNHSAEPKTAAAYLARALSMRYRSGRKGLTIASCDNIPSNGKVLKNGVLFFCRELYPDIVSWVEGEVSFPCSMVDRITPVTTPALVEELQEHYGIADRWPVCGEDFRQWVLEDNFKSKVPRYGEAGVQIVKDVEPYELMKMRLLNGSHSAMSYPSYLLGCRWVEEGITNPLIKTFIRKRYMEEVTPTLEPVPGIDLTAYKDTLVSRFSNKHIGDTILRLCSEGTSKIPNFMVKPLSEAIRQGRPVDAIIFALACWSRFLEGKDEQGEPIPLEDANGPAMAEAARKAQGNPAAFLSAAGLRDLSPAQVEAAAGKFKSHLDAIHRKGIKRALEEFLGTS
ncbi:MAG: mannitol dehydrogenase family protein [Treponema sp.]|nr:mannitol dehydrogenase family protein [Treponema sp.]